MAVHIFARSICRHDSRKRPVVLLVQVADCDSAFQLMSLTSHSWHAPHPGAGPAILLRPVRGWPVTTGTETVAQSRQRIFNCSNSLFA